MSGQRAMFHLEGLEPIFQLGPTSSTGKAQSLALVHKAVMSLTSAASCFSRPEYTRAATWSLAFIDTLTRTSFSIIHLINSGQIISRPQCSDSSIALSCASARISCCTGIAGAWGSAYSPPTIKPSSQPMEFACPTLPIAACSQIFFDTIDALQIPNRSTILQALTCNRGPRTLSTIASLATAGRLSRASPLGGW